MIDKTTYVLKGGKQLHKDGTTGEGSGGKRQGAGRKNTSFSQFKPASTLPVVEEFENRYAEAPEEHLAAFNELGKQIFETSGNADVVNIPDKFLDWESLQGAILTHNHPTPSVRGLDLGDLTTAFQNGAAEVRVVDDRYTHRFIFPQHKNEKEKAQYLKNITASYSVLHNALTTLYSAQVKNGSMSEEDMADMRAYRRLLGISQRHGGQFERVLRSG